MRPPVGLEYVTDSTRRTASLEEFEETAAKRIGHWKVIAGALFAVCALVAGGFRVWSGVASNASVARAIAGESAARLAVVSRLGEQERGLAEVRETTARVDERTKHTQATVERIEAILLRSATRHR